jgi:alkanesulfonate monooxygenase SsuD/methylene tetrahydromethanopterin reductase-like flavin-dependent oxidoreductase (luciferase family)
MRIGLINQLNGRPDGTRPAPTWESIKERAATAEATGFDVFVFEDAMLYKGERASDGVWEATTIAAAVALVTERMAFGTSVINSPYRSPAIVAKIAETIDEISGGRFVLGIGAGNTPESDYLAFGAPADMRYSRFAEAIQIIHALLKTGAVDFQGEFYSAVEAEMVLRGPSKTGPPINIAAGSPKMLQLAARYGDLWNWWGWDETLDETVARMRPIVEHLDRSCEAEGRDPATLARTLDLYLVVPEPFQASFEEAEEVPFQRPVTGSHEEIASHLISLAGLGFSEIRCDLWPKTTEAIAAMQPVVDLVHTV